MKNEVEWQHHQLDPVTLSKNDFWSVLYTLVNQSENVTYSLILSRGFVKSADHRPTNYGPTNHQPPTQRLIDQLTTELRITDPTNKILFQRLDKSNILILQKTNRAGKMKNYNSVYYLFDNFKRLQKKTAFL